MTEDTWNSLKAACAKQWPRMPNAPWVLDEAKRRALAIRLDEAQVRAAFANYVLTAKGVPSIGRVLAMLEETAQAGELSRRQAERAIESGRAQAERDAPIERAPAPWKVYARDPDEAVRMYPWLLEPREDGGPARCETEWFRAKVQEARQNGNR